MKHPLSLLACIVVAIVMLYFRSANMPSSSDERFVVTDWDAFGYYIYLPSTLIYGDVKRLDWLPSADSTYQLTGGKLYQASRQDNTNFVFKYFGGVAICQLPLFTVGHTIAGLSGHGQDGFSRPYQLAIAWGALLYAFLALLLIRLVLLNYFTDTITAISIALLGLATNLIQYVAVDGGMSHVYLFLLYAIVVYSSMRWHRAPRFRWAIITGFFVGLATICRPTDAVILFVPLLWGIQNKQSAKLKWQTVLSHKPQVFAALLAAAVGILPQLIYWKTATDSWVHNVGSKWYFLDPYFRVLFGWENGWFIYTPITVFFIIGMLFINKFPFKYSVIVCCLLSIWIVISWSDWQYGATYSTRALVQTYPLFILAFAAFIQRIVNQRIFVFFLMLVAFFSYVNIFQLHQYNDTILHYRDMNKSYYERIYLNSNPSPLDMSLLDTDEFLYYEKGYNKTRIDSFSEPLQVDCKDKSCTISVQSLAPSLDESWILIEASISSDKPHLSGFLECRLDGKGFTKTNRIRLNSPISKQDQPNEYAFYVKLPKHNNILSANVSIQDNQGFSGTIESFAITHFTNAE